MKDRVIGLALVAAVVLWCLALLSAWIYVARHA